jgi:uncharacterized protein (UPF0276 family)
VSEVVERADCALMFDVNNVYVSAYNHGFDPLTFVRAVPHERIVQIHLAGHTNLGRYIIDTHRGNVSDPVLELYLETIRLTGPVSTLVEWDDEIPAFPVLSAEAEKVRSLRDAALAPDSAGLANFTFLANSLSERDAPSDSSLDRAWQQGGPQSAITYEHIDSENYVTQEAE